MKTKWANLFTILLLTTVLFLAVGCGDDDNIVTNDITDIKTLELFDTWAQSAVTVDGVGADLADFFDWSEATVGVHITFNDDFTYDVNEFNASDNTIYSEHGTITVTGSHIIVTVTSENGTEVTPYVVVDGTWVITGNTLTVSATIEGVEVVLTFTKVV